MLSSCPGFLHRSKLPDSRGSEESSYTTPHSLFLATLHGYCAFGKGVGGVNATTLHKVDSAPLILVGGVRSRGWKNVMNPSGKAAHRANRWRHLSRTDKARLGGKPALGPATQSDKCSVFF